ncbi:MAG: hypothetical protein AB7U25_20030 [Vicinamibacterales bacterium]
MTRKTRNFVLGAGGILAVGLTTGLVASLGLSVATTQAAGPAELEYVPAEATAVGYANVQEVMASELRQRLRRLEPDTRERDDFEAKTGVDIERDIDSVVGAVLPTAAGDREHRPLVVARGRFDQVRIEGLAREHGGQVAEYQGVRLLTHTDGDKPMALGFLEPGVLAVGSADAVRGAIDAKRSGRSVLSNTDLMRLVNDIDASNAWAVGRFDALAAQTDLPGSLGQKMPTLSWFSASGHLNGGVSGTIKAEAKDEEAAANLRDMLRGVVAMAKLQGGDNSGLKAMTDSLQLGGEGRTVAVAFAVPAEVFDVLEALREKGGTRRGDDAPR